MNPRPSSALQRTSRYTTLALAVATVPLLAACSETTEPVRFESFGHVHALEMDVERGVLYVASHNGVWEVAVPDSVQGFPQEDSVETRRVADRAQDTMGFTITKEGAMFASGHPDPAEYPDFDPPHLGLIRSSDGAQTWDHISLQKEADFHALEVVAMDKSQFRIYGYDATAGGLRVSDDTGGSWRVGADIDAIDLAAYLVDPDVLFATTSSGLQRSDNAGATFTTFKAEPALTLIEPLSTGLVGIDSDGAVWRTLGDSLSKVGVVTGQYEAFGAFEDGDTVWLLVSDDDGIGVSKDWGMTWTSVVPR